MTRFTYTPLNQVEAVTDAAGGVITNSCDANGNLLSVTDSRGAVTAYTYDVMDRTSTRTDPVGGTESFVSIKTVQRQLGHATASMTLDIYGHLYDDDLDGLADALDDRFAVIDGPSVD